MWSSATAANELTAVTAPSGAIATARSNSIRHSAIGATPNITMDVGQDDVEALERRIGGRPVDDLGQKAAEDGVVLGDMQPGIGRCAEAGGVKVGAVAVDFGAVGDVRAVGDPLAVDGGQAGIALGQAQLALDLRLPLGRAIQVDVATDEARARPGPALAVNLSARQAKTPRPGGDAGSR